MIANNLPSLDHLLSHHYRLLKESWGSRMYAPGGWWMIGGKRDAHLMLWR
jgi:hypothetical protein